MKLKLIALDIDGTLTNDEKKITADTLSTLLKFQEQGIRVLLAPARPAPGPPPPARPVPLSGLGWGASVRGIGGGVSLF